MSELRRNQLLWLTEAGWQAMLASDQFKSQPSTQAVLSHWCLHQLPVVLTRQPTDMAIDQLGVGLPAPTQWRRRKFALRVSANEIQCAKEFPTLSQIATANTWGKAAFELDAALFQSGVQARVYGSFGWQFLTRLAYVHAASDLDLSLQVMHLDQARQVLVILTQAKLPQRLDGEVVFANGQAVAWRELAQLLAGQVSQILMKDRDRVALLNLEDLRAIACGERETLHAGLA